MAKNIVICCDGTGNELADRNSNVVKLCQLLVRDETAQAVYYNPGVGTVPAPKMHGGLRTFIRKVRGLGFGYGITENIKHTYRYLMNTYEEGDNVYFFGFSRGAYTARAVAGMVHRCGLLGKRNEALVDYAYKAYRENFDDAIIEQFKSAFSRTCKPHFMGVWDTVSSVGFWPESFPYTFRNPDLGTIRHAISVDERRAKFRTNLFAKDSPQDIKQVWFPGVHSDVGGGYKEDESGLSNVALHWMLREAEAKGLLLNAAKRMPAPDASGPMHESLEGAWFLLEWIPMFVWNARERKREMVVYRKKARPIPKGALIHKSVFERKQNVTGYNPPNLPQEFVVEP